MESSLRIGSSDFRELRQSGCLYVDKTKFISELLSAYPRVQMPAAVQTSAVLITRPRRFGKSLMLSMLSEFLEISKDSRDVFADLEVGRNHALCAARQNQWLVARISFKSLKGGGTFAQQLNLLTEIMRSLGDDYAFLNGSTKVSTVVRDYWAQARLLQLDPGRYQFFIKYLVDGLHQYYGKMVVLLIDEYDVPLAQAAQSGYYTSMLEFMRTLFDPIRDNPKIKLAVLTGCLRLAREGIFSGVNNFTCSTVFDNAFADCYGFTETEVKSLLCQYGLSHCLPEVRRWYDGYTFGSCENLYCPWDVLHYLADKLKNPHSLPQMYWENTGDTSFMLPFFQRFRGKLQEGLESLLAGGAIMVRLDSGLTYQNVNFDVNNFWNLLYNTGYQNIQGKQVQETDIELQLKIPILEIFSLYKNNLQ